MPILRFLKVAAKDIRVGAVMPSSRFAVRSIMRRVPSAPSAVLEYGPGDGVLTRRLLERMPPDGRLLAIETNPEFGEQLSRIGDPRFRLVRGDATKAAEHAAAAGAGPFDLVISGIPFSLLSDETRRRVVDMTHDLLKPGGAFLVYQTSPLMVPYLKRRFRVRTSIQPLNVPPYFIMHATKV